MNTRLAITTVIAVTAGSPLASAGPGACFPDVLALIQTPSFARGVTLDGDLLVVLHDSTVKHGGLGQEQTGLLIYDIGDPFSPTLLGGLATPGTATDIAITGTLACLADGGAGGLRLIDLADPLNPAEIGVFETPGDALGVAVSGATAAVADGHAGVHLIDIADPANPALISSIDTPGLATDVLLVGDVVYVADRSSGVVAIDITEPQTPLLTAMVGLQGAAVALTLASDGTLWVSQDEGGLARLDLSTPAMPAILDETSTPGTARALGADVSAADAAVYLADLFAGAHRVEPFGASIGGISHTMSTASLLAPAVGVAVRDGIAYVALNHAGVLIANATDCTLCPADFAPDFGTLDLADVVEFAQNFQGDSNYNQPGRAADLAEPNDVTDLADIVAFIEAFQHGCD